MGLFLPHGRYVKNVGWEKGFLIENSYIFIIKARRLAGFFVALSQIVLYQLPFKIL
jgi:hypothetical protein